MSQSEYMHLKLINLSKSVVQHYNLEEKVSRGGYVYVDIKRGVYFTTSRSHCTATDIETTKQ